MDSYTDTTKNSLLLVSYKHKKDTPRKVSMCLLLALKTSKFQPRTPHFCSAVSKAMYVLEEQRVRLSGVK